MTDYETIGVLRLRDSDIRFAELTDAQLCQLYRNWSSENCNGWMSMNNQVITAFKAWAFNSPFELVKTEVV